MRHSIVSPPFSIAARVELWDRVLSAIRDYFRRQNVREVTTAVRRAAPAIEPWIEPIAAPPSWLATSPELAMKRLLAHGAPAMFQIAHVFRHGERGDLHAEEFHLVEWYRPGENTAVVAGDVEEVVATVLDVAASVMARARPWLPPVWARGHFLDAVAQTLGVELGGDEPADRLVREIARVSPDLAASLRVPDVARVSHPPRPAESARDLAAWTSFFTEWSDRHLSGWLAARNAAGVHLDGFPTALSALAQVFEDDRGRHVAGRFESFLDGIELANGYLELRDPVEQRRRFAVVNDFRELQGQRRLPVDEGFLAALEQPGLPPSVGVALGLDRLLLVATGCARLSDISLDLD